MSMPMETITTETELERAGFLWREGKEGVRAIVCAPLEADGFPNAFSTRGGGVSPFPSDALNLAGFDQDSAENINENRRRFISLLEGPWTLAACWQVHGATVRVVRGREDTQSEREHCDALATDATGVLLGVKTADCVPVLLGDSRTGACAAVHAGWRGTLAGIVKHALGRMREEFGTDPADLRAAIGPAALACCYEVGAEVIEAFRAKSSNSDSLFKPTRDGHALVDLHEANRRQLVESGVAVERIHALPLCTMCRPGLFFSYRRDKKIYGRTGRLLSVIGRRANPIDST
ncbi:MAG: purine-nucleoside/S-methyl-5-thioadenosine phosphorylase / adenosine deaminase [Acidobacteriota bacterium]|nr:purine-nucleoside/S-methyl-5-thioadenosine phosphorylase / adenosine deaminase [Acidobacteriota bacterium]